MTSVCSPAQAAPRAASEDRARALWAMMLRVVTEIVDALSERRDN